MLSLSQVGCGAGWRQASELPPGPLPEGQQAQVWHAGRAERWHALILTADSISGVSFLRPRNCDSCRAALARAEVDSVRLGHPERGLWRSVGLTLGGVALVALVACSLDLGGGCQVSD